MKVRLHLGVIDRLLVEEHALLVDLLLVDVAALRHLRRACLGFLLAYGVDAVRVVGKGCQ